MAIWMTPRRPSRCWLTTPPTSWPRGKAALGNRDRPERVKTAVPSMSWMGAFLPRWLKFGTGNSSCPLDPDHDASGGMTDQFRILSGDPRHRLRSMLSFGLQRVSLSRTDRQVAVPSRTSGLKFFAFPALLGRPHETLVPRLPDRPRQAFGGLVPPFGAFSQRFEMPQSLLLLGLMGMG